MYEFALPWLSKLRLQLKPPAKLQNPLKIQRLKQYEKIMSRQAGLFHLKNFEPMMRYHFQQIYNNKYFHYKS